MTLRPELDEILVTMGHEMIRDDRTEIDPEVAAHVLHAFNAGGYPAGDFTQDLIRLLQRADLPNAARLALVFPGYARAVHLAQHVDGGLEQLRAATDPPAAMGSDGNG